jgi:branched-chain amino acid transport system substrate-binding protein
MRHWSRSAVAVLFALVLVAAACGQEAAQPDAATPPAAGGDAPAPAGGQAGPIDADAVLAAAGGECAEPPQGEPLVIGYAADFSDLGGFADVPGSQAAQYMAELINCTGGIEGTPVEVIVRDIQGDPEVTQRAAQELLDAGVHAILGPPFSDFGLPLLNVVQGRVPVIFVASTEAALADAEGYSFLAAFDDQAQAHAAADFAIEQGLRNAVTLSSPGIPYFELNPAMFAARFEAGGGTHLADYTFSLDDADFSTQVNQIANLDPAPDVLYTAMIMPQTGTLLGQLRGAGLTDITVIGADSFDATGVIEAGADAEGVYYTTHGFPSEGSRMQRFLDAYAADRGERLQTVSFGALAADSVLLIANAYANAGQLDGPAIGEALRRLQDVQVITETVSYAGTDGVPVKPVVIHQITGGDIVLADTRLPG